MVRRLDFMLYKFYFKKKKKNIRGEREGFCPESRALSLSLFPVPCLFLSQWKSLCKNLSWGFPGGAVVGNLPAKAGDTGSSPGLGRSHMPRSN